MAALQGVDLDDNEAEQINEKEDILTLSGMEAAEIGFGINAGLGYMVLGE